MLKVVEIEAEDIGDGQDDRVGLDMTTDAGSERNRTN